jgi:hypothetical protein
VGLYPFEDPEGVLYDLSSKKFQGVPLYIVLGLKNTGRSRDRYFKDAVFMRVRCNCSQNKCYANSLYRFT